MGHPAAEPHVPAGPATCRRAGRVHSRGAGDLRLGFLPPRVKRFALLLRGLEGATGVGQARVVRGDFRFAELLLKRPDARLRVEDALLEALVLALLHEGELASPAA